MVGRTNFVLEDCPTRFDFYLINIAKAPRIIGGHRGTSRRLTKLCEVEFPSLDSLLKNRLMMFAFS